MYSLGGFWSCLCRYIPRGYGRWRRDDGSPTSGSLGACCPELGTSVRHLLNALTGVPLAIQGTARMALQPGAHPARIKDAVTSEHRLLFLTKTTIDQRILAPGGCTIAGLLALEDGRVRSTIARAIQIATERASELGQPPKR